MTNVDSSPDKDDQVPNTCNLEKLAEAAADSNKTEYQLAAVQSVRKLLSSERNPLANDLIKSNILFQKDLLKGMALSQRP